MNKPLLLAAPTNAAPGAPGTPAALQGLADGSQFVPKSVQRQPGLHTQPARLGDLAATIKLNGKVVPYPNASGLVQAAFAGTVMPGPKGTSTVRIGPPVQ